MPKIQEYPDITGLYDNNQFITERPNSETGKISYENMRKGLWSKIVGSFEGQYDNITLERDYSNYTMKIKGHTIGYWDKNTDYMYGDLLLSNQENSYPALYMSYHHTSPETWEEGKNQLLFISAPNYYYSFSFSPTEEWTEQNGYYATTKSCSAMMSSCYSTIYNSFIIDYQYTSNNATLEQGLKDYSYLEYATIDNSAQTLTFYFSKKPEKQFTVKAKVLYENYGPAECYIIKHPVKTINDSLSGGTETTWSADKILNTLKIICDINSIEVILLPEVGEKGKIYKKLTDESNQMIYGDWTKYTEYLWDSSKSSYSALGESEDYLYFNIASLPNISGSENIGYLVQNESNTNQYHKYVWNKATSTFDLDNTFELNEPLSSPTEIITSIPLESGLDNTIYLNLKTDENDNSVYDLSFWSKAKSEFCSLGTTSTISENAVDLSNHMVVGLYQYSGFTGVDGIIYAYQYTRAYWDTNTNSAVSIGTASDYIFSKTYDKSYSTLESLPATGNTSKVYCITNTTNSTLYDLYIWNTEVETPHYMIIGQVPKTSIK